MKVVTLHSHYSIYTWQWTDTYPP